MSIKTRLLKYSDKMPDPPDNATVNTKGVKSDSKDAAETHWRSNSVE